MRQLCWFSNIWSYTCMCTNICTYICFHVCTYVCSMYIRIYCIRSSFQTAKFSKIMVNQRFRKNTFELSHVSLYSNILKHHSLMASSLLVDPGVDAYSLQFNHLNSAVTLEAINKAFLTATSADSIDELGIIDDNGPSGFGKTMPIFIGFFASTRLKYVLQQRHFETTQKYFKIIFLKMACDF